MVLPNAKLFALMCGLIQILLRLFLRRRQDSEVYGLQVQKLLQRRGLHAYHCNTSCNELSPLIHAYVEHVSMKASMVRREISEWLPLSFFHNIVELLRNQLQQGNIPISLASIKGRVLSVEKQVAMALFRLATGASMTAISELFGVGKSTIVESFHRFVKAMLGHRRQHISWPRGSSEMEKIKAGFSSIQGLPNVCGAMDATHIVMERPHGELGLDWLLKNSAFYSCAERGLILNGPECGQGSFSIRDFIVADGGYPLLPWLMRPYTTPTIGSEKLFNYKISATRIVVERAFGLLKTRWRYLLGKVMKPCPQSVAQTIVVCCMLQNMCLENGDGIEDVAAESCDVHAGVVDVLGTDVETTNSSPIDILCSRCFGNKGHSI
ncbi:hypothetical protein L7F22_049239 [Adiantum nelumboides]|nr:hypothetical protein [Adiantum nelumboides]